MCFYGVESGNIFFFYHVCTPIFPGCSPKFLKHTHMLGFTVNRERLVCFNLAPFVYFSPLCVKCSQLEHTQPFPQHIPESNSVFISSKNAGVIFAAIFYRDFGLALKLLGTEFFQTGLFFARQPDSLPNTRGTKSLVLCTGGTN